MDKKTFQWAKERGLLIRPERGTPLDEILRKLRRQIEDELRKNPAMILPVADYLGIPKKRPSKKGGRHGS